MEAYILLEYDIVGCLGEDQNMMRDTDTLQVIGLH